MHLHRIACLLLYTGNHESSRHCWLSMFSYDVGISHLASNVSA
jgi:hypothetical protein